METSEIKIIGRCTNKMDIRNVTYSAFHKRSPLVYYLKLLQNCVTKFTVGLLNAESIEKHARIVFILVVSEIMKNSERK